MTVRRVVSAYLVTILAAGCVSPALATRTVAPQSVTFVIPTTLGVTGRVEITVRTRYVIGASSTIPVRIIATRGTITGPIAARILASGIGERGAVSEVVVTTLVVAPVLVNAGQSRSTAVVWDGRDAKGKLVPADAYALVMDFRLAEGTTITNATAGATIQWDLP